VARVVAYIPDLLFGSQVVGALRGEGHEVELVTELEEPEPGVEVVVVDLTADASARIERAVSVAGSGPARLMAFYSHVESDVRRQAEQAGFGLVVPRSRMAREGEALVARLAEG